MKTDTARGTDTTEAPVQPLTFDVVIATRNRPEALALSIPVILAQSRQPERLIVIDSSDHHSPVKTVVEEAVQDWQGDVTIVHSAKGLPYQRNIGLTHVTGDIVIFPDDDSFFYPGAFARILDVYETDRAGLITGVCAAEVMVPPDGLEIGASYDMAASHHREARTRRLRNRMEKRMSALKPALYIGKRLSESHVTPAWLAGMDAVPVEYMTGFRMSFRSAAIKAVQFDDALRNYGLDEDVDASLSVARAGLVVGARQAKVYHHRFPSGRGNGYSLGVTEVLNRIYVGLKHGYLGPFHAADRRHIRRMLVGFMIIKTLVALPGVRSEFGRARIRGALAALRASGLLLSAPADALETRYNAALARTGML